MPKKIVKWSLIILVAFCLVVVTKQLLVTSAISKAQQEGYSQAVDDIISAIENNLKQSGAVNILKDGQLIYRLVEEKQVTNDIISQPINEQMTGSEEPKKLNNPFKK